MAARILVADDCPGMRSTIAALLEREGHSVVGLAADGAEAARLCAQVAPDVAVLDLSMPVLDGFAAAREIRHTCPRTRLILLTIHPSEAHITLALHCGLDAFVAKSDAAEDLSRAVSEVLAGGRFLSLKATRVLLDSMLQGRGPGAP